MFYRKIMKRVDERDESFHTFHLDPPSEIKNGARSYDALHRQQRTCSQLGLPTLQAPGQMLPRPFLVHSHLSPAHFTAG